MCYTGITRCAAAEGSSGGAVGGSTPSLIFPTTSSGNTPTLTFPSTPASRPTTTTTPGDLGGTLQASTPTLTFPSMTGGQPTVSTPGQPTGATPQALPTSWLDDLGITEAPVRHVHMRYCGLNLQDAHDRCAVNVPCPDGRSNNCLAGQTCFPIPSACMDGVFPDTPTPPTLSGGVTPPAAAVTPSPMAAVTSPGVPTPTAAPATSTTDKPVFDPTQTQFCGVNYNDALNNCFRHRPCPKGTPEECPKGQGCYSGITNCETPPPSAPVPSASPMQELATNLNRGEPGSASTSPTSSPAKTNSMEDWSWVISDSNGGGSQSHRKGLFLQSLAVGGTVFGLILVL